MKIKSGAKNKPEDKEESKEKMQRKGLKARATEIQKEVGGNAAEKCKRRRSPR